MFTTNTDTLRRSIRQLELGRAAMMAENPRMFCWSWVGAPACGTPGCCWGSTRPFVTAPLGVFIWSWWAREFGLPGCWALLVLWMNIPDSFTYNGVPNVDASGEPISARDRLISKKMATSRKDRARASHLMRLLINRLRHRLAVCEVEQGEWGRQRRAANLPVGLERENAVAKREVACA